MARRHIKFPPAGDYPLKDLLTLQTYWIESDDIASSDSTGENAIFGIPAGTLVVAVGWRCLNAWQDSDDNVVPALIEIGTTGDYDLFATLTAAQLGSSDKRGGQFVFEESTADAVMVANIVQHGGTATQGLVRVWVGYRPNFENQRYVERLARG